MMKSIQRFAVLMLFVTVAACSLFGNRTTIGSQTLAQGQLAGTIIGIDAQTREIVIRGDQGEVLNFTAGAEVKNFAQIRSGDRVTLDYSAQVLLELVKNGDGSAGVQNKTSGGTAAPGAKPSAHGERVVIITTVVTAVDAQAGTLTLRGPAGGQMTLMPQADAKLDKVKVGDQLVATVTFSAAVAVAAATPAAH